MRFPLLFLTLLAVGCQAPPAQETAAAAPPSTPDANLRETRWVLRQLAGKSVTKPANTEEAYLMLRTDGAAEGNGSCNSFQGKFSSEKPGELAFTPLRSTRMACPAMSTESEFMRLLSEVGTYRISGDTLRLMDGERVLLVRLEAVR